MIEVFCFYMAHRVDKYVWAVRLTKTRSVATELVSKSKIRINEMEVKPSKEVKVGDILNFHKNSAIFMEVQYVPNFNFLGRLHFHFINTNLTLRN